MAYCIRCGGEIPNAARFCSSCGALQGGPEEEPPLAREAAPPPEREPSAVTADRKITRGARVRMLAYALVAVAAIAALSLYGLQDVPVGASDLEEESADLVTELSGENAIARDEAAERIARYEFCKRRTAPILRELNDLGSRLDVGLAFAEYGEQVGDISVAYSRLRPGSLGSECLKVAVPLETAYRKYAEAYNVWNDCIGDLGCSTDSIEPQLQSKWLEADAAVGRGKSALAAMR